MKYVPENESLLVKNNIFVNSKKNVDYEVTDYIVQRPNQLVLGIPFPLHFYNIGNKNFETDFEKWKENRPGWYRFTKGVFSEKQARRIRNFKKNTHQWWLDNGEAPVIFDVKKAMSTVDNLRLHYIHEGFFNVKVNFEEKELKNGKMAVNYLVETDQPFKIDSITTTIKSPILDSIYTTEKSKSFLKSGDQYKSLSFALEESRLTSLYRNSGIYRFDKNFIQFYADSTLNDYKTPIEIVIADSVGNYPLKINKIKKVTVFTDYSYNNRNAQVKDTVNFDGYTFKAFDELKYNPKYLLNSIFLENGDIYMDKKRDLTRKHLRGLDNFRSVEIKYTELGNDELEATINLTPLKKYALGFNTELTHSNIRQLGISGKLSFLNRNVFRGAEIIKFSVQGSFLDSKDASDNDKLLNAWEAGADVSLELPRLLFPVRTGKIIPKSMAPKTIFTLGTSLQKNIGLDKHKFTGIIDYTWESSATTNHSFQLLNTQFIKNLNAESYFDIYTSEFNNLKAIQESFFPNEILTPSNALNFLATKMDENFASTQPKEHQQAKNIASRHDIITENVLVPAMNYTYTFNNSENYKDTDFSFFRARLVSSGNMTTLLSNEKDEDGIKTMFKTPIAQFFRTDLEYKKFWNLSLENVLAFRSFLGVAIPYGNSSTVPFSRSYFIGGPNDLRAWKIYDLGPGTTQTGLEYNVGNLKFISSLEYRFKIINSIKGALFVDAGNIWDISNSSVSEPAAKFNGFKSLQDIAIGSGFGIRYDLSFILVRLDLGFKTYEPYLESGKKWFQHANFKNNVYNFGISYPF